MPPFLTMRCCVVLLLIFDWNTPLAGAPSKHLTIGVQGHTPMLMVTSAEIGIGVEVIPKIGAPTTIIAPLDKSTNRWNKLKLLVANKTAVPSSPTTKSNQWLNKNVPLKPLKVEGKAVNYSGKNFFNKSSNQPIEPKPNNENNIQSNNKNIQKYDILTFNNESKCVDNTSSLWGSKVDGEETRSVRSEQQIEKVPNKRKMTVILKNELIEKNNTQIRTHHQNRFDNKNSSRINSRVNQLRVIEKEFFPIHLTTSPSIAMESDTLVITKTTTIVDIEDTSKRTKLIDNKLNKNTIPSAEIANVKKNVIKTGTKNGNKTMTEEKGREIDNNNFEQKQTFENVKNIDYSAKEATMMVKNVATTTSLPTVYAITHAWSASLEQRCNSEQCGKETILNVTPGQSTQLQTAEALVELIDLEPHNNVDKRQDSTPHPIKHEKNDLVKIDQDHNTGHDGRKITKKKQLLDKHYHYLMYNESEVLSENQEMPKTVTTLMVSSESEKQKEVVTGAKEKLATKKAFESLETTNLTDINTLVWSSERPESKNVSTVTMFNRLRPYLGPILMAERTFHVTPVKTNSHAHHTPTIESQLREGLITEIKPSGTILARSTSLSHNMHSLEQLEKTTTTTSIVSTPYQEMSNSAMETERTESKISDIQIEIYDSKVDDATDLTQSTISSHKPRKYSLEATETTSSLYASPSSLGLSLSGGTTKPPVSNMQLERFTQYVIDRIETSTPQNFNVSLVETVSGKPEPATIEIHINVSESFGHEESANGIGDSESILSEGGEDETETGIGLENENAIGEINSNKDNIRDSMTAERIAIRNNKQNNEFLLYNLNNNKNNNNYEYHSNNNDNNNQFDNHQPNQMQESESTRTDADVEVKVPDNLGIGSSASGYDGTRRRLERNNHQNDEILVVEIVDPVNNASNQKLQNDTIQKKNKMKMHIQPFSINSNDELFLANVRENTQMSSESMKRNEMKMTAAFETTLPPVPPLPAMSYSSLNNFDRDSDTIFYISNTEVKVGESLPTRHTSFDAQQQQQQQQRQKHNEQERKLQFANRFFPANYINTQRFSLTTVSSIRKDEENQQDFNVQPLHMYEEDIILSSVRNQADSLKIYRNQKDSPIMPPLDVTYVGESIIEVEQSPEMTTTINTKSITSAASTTIASSTSHIPDVIIQPIDLPSDIDIDLTEEDDQSSTSIEEIPPQIELKEFDFMPNEIQKSVNQNNGQPPSQNSDINHNRNNYKPRNQYQRHKNNQRNMETNHLLDSSIQYGGDLIDESADSGFDGVENSYPFANPAEIVNKDLPLFVSGTSPPAIPLYRVHHLHKEHFGADEPQQFTNELDAPSNQHNESLPLSVSPSASSISMTLNNSNTDRILTVNGTLFHQLSTTEEDKNFISKDDDFMNLISIIIGLFIILIPLVVSIGMFCALRFFYNKYQTTSSSLEDNVKGDPTSSNLSTNHSTNIVGEMSLTIPDRQISDSTVHTTIDIESQHITAAAVSNDQSKRLSANVYNIRELDTIDEYQDTNICQGPNISQFIAVQPMHFSSKTSEDVALIIASAPLPASDINTTLPLSVQQLPLNQFCMAVSNNFYPVFHRPLLQKKQSLYSSQPPPPNGSVTKMTMENNLLTIETEERNDISRMARETRMDYNKDGVFVVEVSRGIDSKSIPGSPIVDDPDRTVSLFESSFNGSLFKNNKIQIHSPPIDNHEEIVRGLQQRVEAVEPSYTPQLTTCLRRNSGTVVKPSICTGLSQSNSSLASSNDSNKQYCYGNQELYVIENATDGKLTTFNVKNWAANNSSNDSYDDDRKSQNGQETLRPDFNLNNDSTVKSISNLPTKSPSEEDQNNNTNTERCDSHLEATNQICENIETQKISPMIKAEDINIDHFKNNLSVNSPNQQPKEEMKTSTFMDTLPDLIPDNKTQTIDSVANSVAPEEIGDPLPEPPTTEELYCKDANEESINESEMLTTAPSPPPPTPPLPSTLFSNSTIIDEAKAKDSLSTTTQLLNGKTSSPIRNIDLNKNCYQESDAGCALSTNSPRDVVAQLATEMVSTSTSLSPDKGLVLNGNNGNVMSGPLTPPASPQPDNHGAHFKHLYLPTLARAVDVNGS